MLANFVAECHCGQQHCRANRCHNPRCMFHEPIERCNRAETLDREAIEKRWPRLVRALQYVAILSHSEAACALRDLHRFPKWGGSEAIVHFGGPLRCVREAIRTRSAARRLGYFADCIQCGARASGRFCSQGCAYAWNDGPGSRRPEFRG